MRLNNFLLLLTLLLVPLSGCLGFGDEGEDDHSDDCDHLEGDAHDACHEAEGGHGGEGNETHGGNGGHEGNETEVPNELPNATLIMTADSDGRVLTGTDFILPGENVTFSAVGSSDSDGEIDLIGLTVKDSNETRTVQLLDDAGNFVNVSLQFNYVGAVEVTLRVLDNRGEGIQLASNVFVNERETHTTAADNLYAPNQSGCTPAGYNEQAILIAQQFYTNEPFIVNAGAKWFSVSATGTDHVAICGPDGELATGGSAAETEEGNWTPSPRDYYVAIYPDGPATSVDFEIIVHYESKPAA
ncbi:MAG: hypothetical protein ACPHID_02055 [Thermoplasmatota archaeon]